MNPICMNGKTSLSPGTSGLVGYELAFIPHLDCIYQGMTKLVFIPRVVYLCTSHMANETIAPPRLGLSL